MSDSPAFDFGKFIPGFDFLQNLASSAKGPAGPVSALHNWVAPTVSVEELDKRIAELKAVLFWLEQNSTALKATIQALEVQKMTLATLQGMNLSMAEVAKAFTVATPAKPAAAPASELAAPPHWPFAAAAAPAAQPAAAPAEVEPEPEPEPEPPTRAAGPARKTKAKAAGAPVTGAAVGRADAAVSADRRQRGARGGTCRARAAEGRHGATGRRGQRQSRRQEVNERQEGAGAQASPQAGDQEDRRPRRQGGQRPDTTGRRGARCHAGLAAAAAVQAGPLNPGGCVARSPSG